MDEIRPPYPRRRQDLRITDQNLAGETVFIVVDEERNAYYSFPEVEFAILWKLDGDTPLEKVKESVEEMVPDIEIPLEHLQAFVEDLGKKNLLEGGEAEKAKRGGWRTLFYYRVASFNPEAMLEKLLHPLSFLYSRPFVYLGLILIFWSLSFSYVHGKEWLREAEALFRGWGLLSLYLSFLGVAFVHETGHSLTCRYFGGRVKEMGFMLIYFEPAFYANVTDAYAFPKKTSRMYVGLAGLYFQFILGAFVTMIWYLAIPGSFLSRVCVAIMAMNGLTAFWNLNPLIKLDGYYVLNDFLEVVNLRSHSFEYFGWLFQKIVLGFREAGENIRSIAPRLRKIYFWYGAFGIAYTSFFLGILLLFLARLAARKLAGGGLLLVAGGIAWGAWNWYRNAAPGLSKLVEKVREEPELQQNLKSRGKFIGGAAALLFLLSLIPVHSGIKGPCVVRPALQRVLAPLETGVIARVNKKEGDEIRKGETFAELDDFDLRQNLLHLEAEEKYEKDRLALLKAEYGSTLTQARGEYSEAQIAVRSHALLSSDLISQARDNMEKAYAQYHKLHLDLLALQSGNPPPEIDQLREDLKTADTQLGLAGSEWRRYQSLAKQGLVAPRKTEEKKAAYETALSQDAALKDKLADATRNLAVEEKVAQAEYQASLKAYNQTLKESSLIAPEQLREQVWKTSRNLGYTVDKAAQIKAAQDSLAEVETGIDTVKDKLARAQIKSPINGIIMTPHVQEMAGRMVEKGQAVAWVYKPGAMIFEIQVGELDIPEIPVKEGQSSVVVKVLPLAGISFHGKILRVVPAGVSTSSGEAYLVDVEIDQGADRLLPGMKGTGKIYGKMRPFLWQILRRPVDYVVWKLWGLF